MVRKRTCYYCHKIRRTKSKVKTYVCRSCSENPRLTLIKKSFMLQMTQKQATDLLEILEYDTSILIGSHKLTGKLRKTACVLIVKLKKDGTSG